MSGKELTLQQLNDKVSELSIIVEKQSKIIGSTGQQLLDLQIKNVKSGMNDIDLKSTSQPAIDTSDFITNEDIIQLVGELQGQLDFLEERGIRRNFNSRLSETTPSKIIAPISNKDGEFPNEEIWPTRVEDLLKIDKFDLVLLCEFYELVIPVSQQEDLKDFLKNDDIDPNQVEKLLASASNVGEQGLKERVDSYDDGQIDDLFDQLTRYLGIPIRRNKYTW